ncbi:TPA: hypothetical protein HA251_03290 [Candidatus Woesearchaeota archaeon]|nr:hypothetical protein [Candidatus Woesearchaeota archaeon]
MGIEKLFRWKKNRVADDVAAELAANLYIKEQEERAEQKAFLSAVEITPEPPLDYQARKGIKYEIIPLLKANAGLTMRVYREGCDDEWRELGNKRGSWRELKEQGLVALLCAQRYVEGYVGAEPRFGILSRIVYYGVPIRVAVQKPDDSTTEVR